MSWNFQHRGLLAAGVLSAWMLAACGGGYGGGYYGGGYNSGGYYGGGRGDSGQADQRREAARQGYQADLERRVAAALNADPRTKIYDLKVTAQGDGVVVISGTPANGFMGRDMALRVASRVPGVRSVGSNLTMN